MVNGWTTHSLKSITQKITKGTTPTSLGRSFVNIGINFIKIESISKDGEFIPEMFEHIDEDTNHLLNRSILEKGDILYSIAGALGRTAIVKEQILPANTNQALAIIRLKSAVAIDRRYLYYQLNSTENKKLVEEINVQGAQANLSLKNISEFMIPFPDSIVEQQAIATALSDMDELITNLEKLIEKKKAIKQGTMQALLTGKKRLPGFIKPWQTEIFGELCVICRGGSPRPIQAYLTTHNDGINWIKIGDVKQNAKYITSTQEKIIEAGASKSRRVYKGDFILSNSMSFGRPYILKVDGCIHDGWLAIQEYQKSFDINFLYYLLGADYVFKQYIQMAAGSSVQNLNKEKVAQLIVYIPSIEEQKAIASILSDMDSEVEKLEEKLEKYRLVKQGMMHKLLTGEIRLV